MFDQDFNEQFEGYTQPDDRVDFACFRCLIRISMNNLKDIHNEILSNNIVFKLFDQDFNEQFEGYTQLYSYVFSIKERCLIRISMNNLKDIHNALEVYTDSSKVV